MRPEGDGDGCARSPASGSRYGIFSLACKTSAMTSSAGAAYPLTNALQTVALVNEI